MKKILRLLQSMKFGMLLLTFILACLFAGSLIPQQHEEMDYVRRYGEQGARMVLALRLDDVFHTPYFIALLAALSINLIFCSILRLPAAKRRGRELAGKAQAMPEEQALSLSQGDRLAGFLKKKGFKAVQTADGQLFKRHRIGIYGSFCTHLSILLVLLAGSAVLYWADVRDVSVMPGETLTLEDGSTLTVEAFHISDETGRLDYASRVTIVSKDGSQKAEKEIRVNEPLRFGQYKVYQQTYATAGCIRIHNAANDISDTVTLTEPSFLTLDGRNGVFYSALYPGYIKDEDGHITLITHTSGDYTDPVYDLRLAENGAMKPVLGLPGETLKVGDISFTMMPPVSYPGLRIKVIPPVLLGLMYAAFVLMVLALYLCFFMSPVYVKMTPAGYAMLSQRAQPGLVMEIENLLSEGEE